MKKQELSQLKDEQDFIAAIVEQYKDYHHTAEEIVNSEILISVNSDGSLVTKSGKNYRELIYNICELCDFTPENK